MIDNADPPPPPPPLPTRPAGTGALLAARAAAPGPAVTEPYIPGAPPAVRSRDPRALAISGGLLLAAVVVMGLLFFNASGSPGQPSAGACDLCGKVLEFADQGHTHILVGATHPPYNSDPPTSGWHREEFPSGGAADVLREPPLEDEVSVHLMEHGMLIAWYSCPPGPDCTRVRDSLVAVAHGVVSRNLPPMYVMARPTLPDHAVIALGAWQHLEYLADFDKQNIDDFVQHFDGSVQENMPAPTATPPPQ